MVTQILKRFRKYQVERSMEVPDYDYDDREIIVLPMLGRNIYWDPWHLEVDLSREFKSFIPRSELVGLIRVSLIGYLDT